MDQLEILKRFIIESKENGSLSLFLKEGNDSDNLKEDLMRMLNNLDNLKIDDPPEKFDSILDDIDNCVSDNISLIDILDRMGGVLYEVYNIILSKYIPDDFYDDE